MSAKRAVKLMKVCLLIALVTAIVLNVTTAYELRVGSAEIYTGETAEIPVYLTNVNNATALNFTLYYDPGVVHIQGIEPAYSGVTLNFSDVDNINGVVKLVIVFGSWITASNISLVNLSVVGVGNGTTYLEPVNVELSNGTFVPVAPENVYPGIVYVTSNLPDLVGFLHVYDEFGRETTTLKIHKSGDVWNGKPYDIPFVVVNATYEIRNLYPENPVKNVFVITGTYRSYSYDKYLSSQDLSDLNEDGVLNLSDSNVVDASNLGIRCYNFSIYVDSGNVIPEVDEQNNNRSYTICMSKPDLVPILNVPSPLLPGANAITVGASNEGDVWAKETVLKVYVDGSEIASYNVPILYPGSNWTTDLSYDFDTGLHTIMVVVDANDDDTELNESNNVTVETVYASYLKVNVSVIADKDTAIFGDLINVSVWVNSTQDVGTATLRVYFDPAVVRFVSSDSPVTPYWKYVEVSKTPVGSGNLSLVNLTFAVRTQNEGVAHFNVTGVVKHSLGFDMLVNASNDSVAILKYTDLVPRIFSYWTRIGENDNVTVRVSVVNLADTLSEKYTLNVSVFNSSGLQKVLLDNVSYGPVGPRGWDVKEVYFDTTGLSPGEYWLVATVYNDTRTDNNVDRSANITVLPYSIDVWSMYYPPYVRYNSTFIISGYVNVSLPGVVNVTITLPDGLLAWSESGWSNTVTIQKYAWPGKWNWFTFTVKAVDHGLYGSGTDRPINITVEGRGKSDTISTVPGVSGQTDSVPSYSLEVWVPTITLRYTNSTYLGETDSTKEFIIKTVNATTISQNISIVVMAGQQGRVLRGLDYLVYYPYGCVEQTTSAMLGALHVDWYYREKLNGSYPQGYDVARVHESIQAGVERLAKGGERGQHDNGAWSMWGSYPPGHLHYTIIATYGLGRVAEDSLFGNLVKDNLTMMHSSLNAPGKFNFNDTVFWLSENAVRDGNRTYWQWGYVFGGDVATTSMVMVSLYQLVNEGLLNDTAKALADSLAEGATNYLLSVQNADGGWSMDGDASSPSDARSTALAVWALKLYGTPNAVYSKAQIEDAINSGIEWLNSHRVYDTASGGYYWNTWSNPWWDSLGDRSMTTAYTLIALNESRSMYNLQNVSVYPATNSTISGGVRYLTSVYRNMGSFGYTMATQAAVHALTLLHGTATSNVTLNIVVDGVVVKSNIPVNQTSPRVVIKLTPDEIRLINGNGTSNPPSKSVKHTITVQRVSGTGSVIVSAENVQTVVSDEVMWGRDYVGNRILSSGGTIKVAGGEIQAQNELTIQPTLPDVMVAGNTYTLSVRIVNNNNSDLVSPIVTVPLGSLEYNSTFIPEWSTDGVTWVRFITSGSGKNMEYDAVNNTLRFFPDVVPANGFLDIRFRAKVPAGNVTFEARVTPMYNETVTYIASTTGYVAGYGNITVRVYDISGSPVPGASIMLDGISSGSSIKTLEGTHRIKVDLSGYVPVEFDVSLNPGEVKEYTVILATPDQLATPKVLFVEGNLSYAEIESMYTLLSNVSKKPTAQVKAMSSFNLTISGTGTKIVAAKLPKFVRGSLWAWLNDSILVTVNGQPVSYTIANVGGEKVVLVEVVNGTLSMGFEGRKLGDVTDDLDQPISEGGWGKDINMEDARRVLIYAVLNQIVGNSSLAYGDVTDDLDQPISEGGWGKDINMEDARRVLIYAVLSDFGYVDEYYNIQG